MVHVAVIGHEDGGMMHQFVVVRNIVGVDNEPGAPAWSLFPNPTSGQLSMEVECKQASQLQLFSPTGALLHSWELAPLYGPINIDLGAPASGIYLMRWLRPDGVSTRRVMVMKP